MASKFPFSKQSWMECALSGRANKTDDSKVEIQNVNICQIMKSCSKYVRKYLLLQNNKWKKNPQTLGLMGKMEEMVENTDGSMLCALTVNTDGYCKKKSFALMKSYLDKVFLLSWQYLYFLLLLFWQVGMIK